MYIYAERGRGGRGRGGRLAEAGWILGSYRETPRRYAQAFYSGEELQEETDSRETDSSRLVCGG